MRKTVFWIGGLLCGAVLVVTAVAWYSSYQQTHQFVIGSNSPGAWVLTSDRGRLGWLTVDTVAVGDAAFVEMVDHDEVTDQTLTLEQTCPERWRWFGMGRDVPLAEVERPALAGLGADVAALRVVAPHWAVLVLAAGTLLVLWLAVGVKVYRAERGLCTNCAFDISKSSHFCPRCGRKIPRRTWSNSDLPERPTAGT